jgi:hypothetical protein
LIGKYSTLALPIVPIWNNTAQGQLDGLVFALDLLVYDNEIVNPKVAAALGNDRTQTLLRIKAALSDHAASENAYNNALSDLQKTLTPADVHFVSVVSTYCFLHHISGCAESVKKTVRALMKHLTNRTATAFADVSWLPDEEESIEKAAEASIMFTQLQSLCAGLPISTYDDTAWDGIRIFIKLLSEISDYGFNVASKAATMLRTETYMVIKSLQRVVGSRGTQYLHSSAPILRVREEVATFLDVSLRHVKMGGSTRVLNKLELAVLRFLQCDFSKLQLVTNAQLDFSLFRPAFSFLKGLKDSSPRTWSCQTEPYSVKIPHSGKWYGMPRS